ncbi:MAG: hypothetical protein H6819_07725 [Phycisphaerales bacterium]|nr:hypothetical protein [Phycisphaerales bacterium]MCB9854336.1 hypothetical protein [Phycisphaerales bacterium]MCB9863537.1 hypothetical protein [Phycisphaerales bacterium]
MRHSQAIIAVVVGLATTLPTSAAEQRPVSDIVPQEALIAYMAVPYGRLDDPEASTQPTDAQPVSNIATILGFLNASGLIPDEGQIYADIASALPLLGRYEHAIVLLDASSKLVQRTDGSDEKGPLRLKHLEAFIALRTGGNNVGILEHLNRIVGRYTNTAVAHLESQTASDFSYQRLVDSRLPDWAVWEWGEIGDDYVVCFGRGTFEKVAATHVGAAPSLSKDPWYARARANLVTERTLAHWFIGFDRLAKRLGEISQPRVDRVLARLEASDITRDMWVVGLHDRALSWSRVYQRNGDNVVRRYSDPAAYTAEMLGVIPDQARHYTILNVPSSWLVDNIPQAWIASGSEKSIRQWESIWNGLEAETGIDLSGYLSNNLGDHVILFDYPVHPLDIPFAMTIAIEIKNPRAVRPAIDAVMSAWGQYLEAIANKSTSRLSKVNVLRATDGIWYLQMGIFGPALKVTDRYVVVSWSPEALRQALTAMHLDQPKSDIVEKAGGNSGNTPEATSQPATGSG